MLFDGWRSALVLGGIRSGKTAFARLLAAGAGPVRTLLDEATQAEPGRLAKLLTAAGPDEVLLVEDLSAWLSVRAGQGAEAFSAEVAELAEAVGRCPGRVVLVSREVGLGPVPETGRQRALAEAVGAANQAVADACDAVALVVAGQPTWLKRPVERPVEAPAAAPALPPVVTPPTPTPPPPMPPAPMPPLTTQPAAGTRTAEAPTAGAAAPEVTIEPGMSLPLPDEEAAEQAAVRLRGLDVPGSGFGVLADVVRFAAGTQGQAVPRPWQTVRVLLLHGDHDGGAAAGDSPDEAARRARGTAAGESGLGALVAETGAGLQRVDVPTARAMETEDALTEAEVAEALAYGWRLAEQAADSGVDVIVVAACGAGSDTAASAVVAALTRAEPVALLGRVHAPDGRYDDAAWMIRCTAVRDALHRTRSRPRNAHDLLAALGGGDIAVATGVLLGAASRRTPVLLDGPVGVAAGMVGRDLAGQARHWCLLPDDGRHPTVRYAADVLGLRPVLDLGLGLGEGARALAALPLLRSALVLAGSLGTHPALRTGPAADTAEPQTDTAEPQSDAAEPATEVTEEEPEAAEPAASEPTG